jgi:uncharacterized membrane protein (UPF0127 family)
MDYLNFKNHKIPTVLAITSAEQAKGLMYEENLPPAMAFVYTEPRINKFWMSRTPRALDIIFCFKNKIVSICHGEPHSTKLIGGDQLSDLVLEMPLGDSKKLGMTIGDEIHMEYQPSSLSKILLANSINYM